MTILAIFLEQIFVQIRNSPLFYDGSGFLGVKEIMDQADANKKGEIIKEMERRHKEKIKQVSSECAFSNFFAKSVILCLYKYFSSL